LGRWVGDNDGGDGDENENKPKWSLKLNSKQCSVIDEVDNLNKSPSNRNNFWWSG
jgi:hypothetical protein